MSGAATPEKRRELTTDERATRTSLVERVMAELFRQDRKWGVPCAQIQTPERRYTILAEEFGEVAEALDRSTPIAVVTELLQVAAVAIANAERLELGIDDSTLASAPLTSEGRLVQVAAHVEHYARALLNRDNAAAAAAARLVAEAATFAAQLLDPDDDA